MFAKRPFLSGHRILSRHRIPRHLILEDHTSRKRGRLGYVIFIAITVGLLSLLAGVSEASLPQEAVEAGQLLIRPLPASVSHSGKNSGAPDYRPAVHLDSEVHFEISGMVAAVSLVQRFSNRSQHWSEAVYVFPLPETAAVNAMEMRIGERIIRGEIQEKQKARQIYQKAKHAGRKASLVEQQRPNLFTQKVANIAPGETIEVRLGYIQKVDYRHGRFHLRFPMTLTPRYIPGTASPALNSPALNTEESNIASSDNGWGWSRPTDQVPDAHLITPPMLPRKAGELLNPITITATLDAGLPLASVSSDYHNLSLRREGESHHIELAEKRVSMDRDFVLTWEPVVQKAPAAAVFSEEVEGEHYAMVMLLPPQTVAPRSKNQSSKNQGSKNQISINRNSEILPREMVFIIDTSGSMSGNSIRQAKRSLQLAIDRLRPQDQFNVVEFNSTHRVLFPASVPAEHAFIQRAQTFVRGLNANGGTEMAPAIAAALSLPENPGYLKQVVFITDGSVGNERALFAQIEQQLGDARLFTVGIGSAPNSFFMRKAAQFGRGTYTYIGALDEVQEKMSTLFSQLESPVLGDIALTWPGQKPGKQTVEYWPRKLPDLYLGEPLLVSAKLNQPLKGNLTITGHRAGSDSKWQQTLSLDIAKTHTGVANLWARDKIAALMDRKTSGASEAEIKSQVLAVALAHKLVSAYTSFVAVEKKISRPVTEALKSGPVPNAVAKGQRLMPITYPRTATPAPLQLVIGGLCLLLALSVQFWRRKAPSPAA